MRTLGKPRPIHAEGGAIFRAVTSAALCTALLAFLGTVSASAVDTPTEIDANGMSSGFQAGYDAVIGNTNACGPASNEPCPYTRINVRTPLDWDDPDVQESFTVTLTDLATGAPVSAGPTAFHTGPGSIEEMNFDSGANLPSGGFSYNHISRDTTTLLNPGAYRIRASFEYPSHWSCSPYNHPQCIWLVHHGWYGEWRFRYDGHTKVVQPMYQPASIAVTRKFKRKGSAVITRGRVLTAVVDPTTFLLRSEQPTAGARVKVYTLSSRRWVYRKTVTTRSDGTYRARVRQPTKTLFRIKIQPTSAYPGATTGSSYKR
jgi:hypothetical protein